MGQYGEDFVNAFAPGLWDLSFGELPVLEWQIPEVHSAMWNVAAREIFHGEWPPLVTLTVRQFLRRSIRAAQEYDNGIAKLEIFARNHKRDQPNLKALFGALDSFENCILQLAFCVENVNHVLEPSSMEELKASTKSIEILCISIRHSGGQAKSSEQSKIRKLLPVYFESDGISNGKSKATFLEFRDVIDRFLALTTRILAHKGA